MMVSLKSVEDEVSDMESRKFAVVLQSWLLSINGLRALIWQLALEC
jgi:hypothetical protein